MEDPRRQRKRNDTTVRKIINLAKGDAGRGETATPQRKKPISSRRSRHNQADLHAQNDGWFVNTVDTVGSGITTSIYNHYVMAKPTLVHDATGIKLGDQRFYNDVRFNFAADHFIRKGVILLITNPLYKLMFILLTIVHTASMMVQEPEERTVTDSADDSIGWAVVCDRFLLFFYGLDVIMNLLAHGLRRFLLNFFNMVDLVVFASMVGLEVSSTNLGTLPYFLALNALRPFRIVSRIRTMRNIVTVVVRTSTTLVDVLVLLGFLVGVFGTFSLTLFGPAMRSRCYYTEDLHPNASNWTSLTPIVLTTLAGGNTTGLAGADSFNLENFYWNVPAQIPTESWSSFCKVGEDHNGPDGLYTPCKATEQCRSNAPAAYEWGGYDNMLAAMLTTIQVMTLENWSQVAVDVMDACTPFSGLFFLSLTMIGSFWALNLMLATITKSFETFYEEDVQRQEEEQREREKALLATDKGSSIFTPFGNRDKKKAAASAASHSTLMLSEALLSQNALALPRVAFPNEDADSVDRRSQSPSAHFISKMKEKDKRTLFGPPPDLTSSSDPNPYMANPFLRSRWRRMVQELSKQSIASLTALSSVPVADIAKRVVSEKMSRKIVQPHNKILNNISHNGGGSDDESYSESPSFRRLVRGPEQYPWGLDEALREAAGGITGTSYAVRGTSTLSASQNSSQSKYFVEGRGGSSDEDGGAIELVEACLLPMDPGHSASIRMPDDDGYSPPRISSLSQRPRPPALSLPNRGRSGSPYSPTEGSPSKSALAGATKDKKQGKTVTMRITNEAAPATPATFAAAASPPSDDLETKSLRLHTYYEDRVFDAEKVRRQFRDYIPKPVHNHGPSAGLLKLSVDINEDQQRAFEAHNRRYTQILQWRDSVQFDDDGGAMSDVQRDFMAWASEGGTAQPMTMVDTHAIAMGEVAESDSLDDEDDDDRDLSDAQLTERSATDASSGEASKAPGRSVKLPSDESDVSSADSLSSIDSMQAINIHSKADKVFHIHKQYAQQAATMLAERRQSNARLVSKGLTITQTDEDISDEKRLEVIRAGMLERQERLAQHHQSKKESKVLAKLGNRKAGGPGLDEIAAALEKVPEVDTRDGGLFTKISLTAQLRKEIKFLEGFIAKELARKTNSSRDMTSKRVRREAKRGFKIHEKRAKTLKGNLLLIMLGDWYSAICKGAVLFNTIILLFVYYDQPMWQTIGIEVVSYMVDLLLIFDCCVRIWLWSPRKYFGLTTSHFFAFVEHIVVWFALLDLFALAIPEIRIVRVFRVFRFVSSFSAVRRIVRTVQSSIRHLLHIVGFLAIFMIVFTVGGWQIFSGYDVLSAVAECRSIADRITCDTSENCVWVTDGQWLTLTNIEFDQMKEITALVEREAARPARERDNSITRTLSISQTLFDESGICRQYQGWQSLDAGQRFNFVTLFSSFSTVFTVVTKDAWTDVTYNYMDTVTPFSLPFFLAILFVGGFIILPLLVAILLVNFEENNDADVTESRDAALLDEVRRQLNDLGPESRVIAEQLRLREEKDREQKRLRAQADDVKAKAKEATAVQAEEEKAKKRELEAAKARDIARLAKIAQEEAAKLAAAQNEEEDTMSATQSSQRRQSFKETCLTDLLEYANTIKAALHQFFAAFSSTFIFIIVRAIVRYIASFCDRKDKAPERIMGRSLLVFPATSTFRLMCCDIVGGKYFPFEVATFWISVLHCIVTPLNDNSIRDSKWKEFFTAVGGICLGLSIVDMLIRCVAQCAFLGPTYAFARVSVLNAADFIAVICSIIAATTELSNAIPDVAGKYLWALSGIRPLRVVVRSSSVIMVLEAILFAIPDMANVIGVFGGATLIFAVIGVEQLQGTLKTCQDGSDRSEHECIGFWVAQESDGVYLRPGQTGYLMERSWKNPRQFNFDNAYSATATLMEICVASQWGAVLFSLVDTPWSPGGSPSRNQNQHRSLYVFFWLVISNFVLLNIFVGTVVNSFRKYRSMQSESFFGMETAETRAVKQILEGTTAKKRLMPPEVPFLSRSLNRACYALTRLAAWRRISQFFLVANTFSILSIHYGESEGFDVAQFVVSNVCALFYMFELLAKMCIAGPSAYLRLGFNQIQFIVVLLAIVEIIMFAGYGNLEDMRWFRVTWTFRVVALAKEIPSVRRLLRVGMRSLPAMVNIGSLLMLLFYFFSICGMALFKNVRTIAAGRDSLNQNLNFRTFPSAMITLYRIATLDDWGDIVAFSGPSEPFCSDDEGTCGNRTLARFFFTFFVVSIAFVMLNLFIAVVLENFELSELIPDNLREREEDVQRFRQAWGKMASGNHLKIHARDFVPLLKELPGPRARLQMLRAKQASDPDFNMTEEQMNHIAKKYAFGLQGEETQTYIKSLLYLQVPIIMPSQEVLFNDALGVISRLLFNDYLTSDTAGDIEEAVMAERPVEYKDGFTVAHHYCCNRIITLIGSRRGTKLQYPKWSRFLDPIFREIYERNSTAVIGANSSKSKGQAASDKTKDAKKESAISVKKYGLADYLRSVLDNTKVSEDDDSRWRSVIRDTVSEGSSDEDSGSDGCLPDELRGKAKDETSKRREAIRNKLRMTGDYLYDQRDGMLLNEEGGGRFMDLEDRMVLLQGRQDIGATLTQRRNNLTGGTSQLPTLDEMIARRARQKAKMDKRIGMQVSTSASAAASSSYLKARLRRIAIQDSIAPAIWRKVLSYDNSTSTRKGPMTFLSAVMEASKQAKGDKVAGGPFPVGSSQYTSSHTSALSPELRSKIKSALIRFSKQYKESVVQEALTLRPMYDEDATDRQIKLPTLDDLIKRRRKEKGLPSSDFNSIMNNRQHLMLTQEERFSSEAKYDLRTEDVKVGLPGSVFGHKSSTIVTVPLPYTKAAGSVTPSASDSPRGGMSASSAVSSRKDWGGTMKGSRKRKVALSIEPGEEQHELDRLLGILALKKFARRWRSKVAARKAERERRMDPRFDPDL